MQLLGLHCLIKHVPYTKVIFLPAPSSKRKKKILLHIFLFRRDTSFAKSASFVWYAQGICQKCFS